MNPNPTVCQYKIPYHKKELDYACGAAALRMAIQAFTGVDPSENKLATLLGTKPQAGSPFMIYENNLGSLLEQIGKLYSMKFEYSIKQNGSFEILHQLLNEGYIVLINHTKSSGGAHWAVLYSIDELSITLIDPEFGPKKVYLLDEFDWQGGTKVPTTRAFVAIRVKHT